MKYFFIRLEIQDGEHGYFSDSVLKANNETDAREMADEAAKGWYEEEDVEVETEEGRETKSYYFTYQQVRCWAERVYEISKEHYDILIKYL